MATAFEKVRLENDTNETYHALCTMWDAHAALSEVAKALENVKEV